MRRHRPVVLILLLAVSGSSAALTTSESFAVRSGTIHVTIAVENPPASKVLASMKDGLESEIQYNVRVYEHTTGVLGFFSDKLIGEFRNTYLAQWDEFSGEFAITRANGRSIDHTASSQQFLDDFFTLANADTGIQLPPGGPYYALSEVRIQIVRLVPPLTMIAPFLSGRRIRSKWIRTEIGSR